LGREDLTRASRGAQGAQKVKDCILHHIGESNKDHYIVATQVSSHTDAARVPPPPHRRKRFCVHPQMLAVTFHHAACTIIHAIQWGPILHASVPLQERADAATFIPACHHSIPACHYIAEANTAARCCRAVIHAFS
jgi:hypothetical protein